MPRFTPGAGPGFPARGFQQSTIVHKRLQVDAGIFTVAGQQVLFPRTHVITFTADTGEVWTFRRDRISARGLLRGGLLIGTDLKAISSTSFYNTDGSMSMYGSFESDPFYKQDLFGKMTYETKEIPVTGPLVGSQAIIASTIQGVGIQIFFRNVGPNPMYGADADPFYGLDTDPFYEKPPAYSVYTGPFIIEDGVYQIKVVTSENATRGVIDHLTLTVDAPDIFQNFDNIAISASGTRLPVTAGKFTSIKNVQLTLQNDVGSTAVTAEYLDKDVVNGPLVKCFNSSHVAVTGNVDALVKGY